jgi:hypothetical protein
MQGLQASDFAVGWNEWQLEAHQADTFEALEHPAHRRAICRLLELIGHPLAGGRKLRAQPVLGEPIDQQAEDHHEAEGDDAGGLLDEDGGGQKQRVLEKTEAPLDTVLFLVRLDQLLVGELAGVQDICGDEEGGLALDRTGDGLGLHRDGSRDLPFGPLGCRARAWASWAVLFRMSCELAVHRQP